MERCGDVYEAASRKGEIFWLPFPLRDPLFPIWVPFLDIERLGEVATEDGGGVEMFTRPPVVKGDFLASFFLLRSPYSPFGSLSLDIERLGEVATEDGEVWRCLRGRQS